MFIIISVAAAYLLVGVVVGLVHPGLFRELLVDIRSADFGKAGFFWKPMMALVFFVLICVLWPIAWIKRRESEKRMTAQLERLRPFAQVYAAANRSARYPGGDGSSFENAVVILDAKMLSGMGAEYDYIAQHHPGYKLRKQSFKEHEGSKFDILELVGAAGDEKILYFDISGFYAKPRTTSGVIDERSTFSSDDRASK